MKFDEQLQNILEDLILYEIKINFVLNEGSDSYPYHVEIQIRLPIDDRIDDNLNKVNENIKNKKLSIDKMLDAKLLKPIGKLESEQIGNMIEYTYRYKATRGCVNKLKINYNKLISDLPNEKLQNKMKHMIHIDSFNHQMHPIEIMLKDEGISDEKWKKLRPVNKIDKIYISRFIENTFSDVPKAKKRYNEIARKSNSVIGQNYYPIIDED